MLNEAHLAGVLFAPIVVYGVLAALLFVPLRIGLSRASVLSHVWHPALVEVALYAIILSLLVLVLT